MDWVWWVVVAIYSWAGIIATYCRRDDIYWLEPFQKVLVVLLTVILWPFLPVLDFFLD